MSWKSNLTKQRPRWFTKGTADSRFSEDLKSLESQLPFIKYQDFTNVCNFLASNRANGDNERILKITEQILKMQVTAIKLRTGSVSPQFVCEVFKICRPTHNTNTQEMMNELVQHIHKEQSTKPLCAEYLLMHKLSMRSTDVEVHKSVMNQLPARIPTSKPYELALMMDIVSSGHRRDDMRDLFIDRIRSLIHEKTSTIPTKTLSYLMRSISYTIPTLLREPEIMRYLHTQFIAGYGDCTSADAMMISRSLRRAYRGHPRISEMMDFCEAEIVRNLHKLPPHDIADSAIIWPNNELIRVTFFTQLSGYSPRQISLVLNAVSQTKNSTDFCEKVLDHYESNPDRILDVTSRDWAVNIYSINRAICDANDSTNRSLIEKFNKYLEKFLFQKMKYNFREISMIIFSVSSFRQLLIRSSQQYSLPSVEVADSVLNFLASERLPQIFTLPRTCAVFSTQSVLACLWGLAGSGVHRNHQYLVNMHRILYSRLPSLTPDQVAFSFFMISCFSSIRGNESILHAFLLAVEPGNISNNNLVNVAIALRKWPPSEIIHGIRDKCFDELYARGDNLSAEQFVTALHITSELDDRKNFLPLISRLRDQNRVNELSVTCCVRLFCSLSKLPIEDIREVREKINFGLIEKLKNSTHAFWSGNDLIMFAREIHRLGRNRVKPNLRDRFLIRLMIGIKSRQIPTKMLLENLRIIDDLGTFHRLPFYLQEHLYKKATDEQREGLRRPHDPAAGKPMNSPRRLFSRSLGERVDGQDPYKGEGKNREEELQNEQQTVQIEFNNMKNGDHSNTPIAQFIQKVRQYS